MKSTVRKFANFERQRGRTVAMCLSSFLFDVCSSSYLNKDTENIIIQTTNVNKLDGFKMKMLAQKFQRTLIRPNYLNAQTFIGAIISWGKCVKRFSKSLMCWPEPSEDYFYTSKRWLAFCMLVVLDWLILQLL